MKISLGLPKPLFRLSYMKLELLIFNWEQTGVMSNFWMTVFGLGNLKNVICLSTHQSQITIETHFYFTFKWLLLVQLNEYETDPYFLQLFQSNTAVCLIIYMFCKICERKCEPEIVLFWFLWQKTISCLHLRLQILQNA